MALWKKNGIWESTRVVFLPVERIAANPMQPRKAFSPQGLDELAESIRAHGILHPLTVRRVADRYELISGERRLRAAKQLGLATVPCLIAGVDETESSLLALVENLQRSDLNFMEEAEAISCLIRQYDLSQEAVAQKIGKSQSAVANKLRLLKLPPDVVEQLQSNHLTERHARALLRLEGPLQLAALEQIVENGFNVAQTESYVDALLDEQKNCAAQPEKASPAQARAQNTYVIKDVRFFLNSITRGMRMMKNAGVDAEYGRTETEDDILLTIRIPKRGGAA